MLIWGHHVYYVRNTDSMWFHFVSSLLDFVQLSKLYQNVTELKRKGSWLRHELSLVIKYTVVTKLGVAAYHILTS